MTETWLPGFVKDPGPAWKQGYYGMPSRTLGLIEGDVKHDAAGPWSALLGELHHPTRQASWTFSLPTAALPGGFLGHQHYPLEAITWHCGKPGDADLNTAYIGNITLVGIEHARVGTSPAPLTPFQVDVTSGISSTLRQLTSAGRFTPELGVNLFEHNWISGVTACPSGRIPWDQVLAQLEGDDDMTDADRKMLQEVWGMLRFTLGPGDGELLAETLRGIAHAAAAEASAKVHGEYSANLRATMPTLYHPEIGWINGTP